MNILKQFSKPEYGLAWNSFYKKLNYKFCSKSVLDNISNSNITFNNSGICNYHYDYLKYYKNFDKLYPVKEKFIS